MAKLLVIIPYDCINGTPAVPLALRGQRELMEAGFLDDTLLLQWDQKALTAVLGGEVVGVLVYQDVAWKQEVHVVLGYVLPEHREKGVYRALWGRLVEEARRTGRRRIIGEFHVKNKVMREVSLRLAREVRYITTVFDVPPKEE